MKGNFITGAEFLTETRVMFHESLTAHASKADDSCAYCTGHGEKIGMKEMLCSKVSQKFNTKAEMTFEKRF